MQKQPIVFDTTYLLPIFGFHIDLSTKFENQIESIWAEGHPNFQIIIPSVGFIEVMYKFNSQYRSELEAKNFNYITESLPTILQSPHISIFPAETNLLATEMAIKIRTAGHSDVMDCYIAGTAFAVDGIYLTEEKTIQKVLKTIPEFNIDRIWNWSRFMQEISV
jgi:predicted nucleic-acid-binding protein